MQAEKKAERRQIQQEPWCQDLIKRMGRYKERKARIEVLQVALDRSTYPSSRMVSNYDATSHCMPGLGVVSPLEIELRELKWEIQLMDAALSVLSDLQRDIVRLKFIENMPDWHITDLYIPRNFKNKNHGEMWISRSTLQAQKLESLFKMGKTLGVIPKSSKIWTLFGTQAPKKEL